MALFQQKTIIRSNKLRIKNKFKSIVEETESVTTLLQSYVSSFKEEVDTLVNSNDDKFSSLYEDLNNELEKYRDKLFLLHASLEKNTDEEDIVDETSEEAQSNEEATSISQENVVPSFDKSSSQTFCKTIQSSENSIKNASHSSIRDECRSAQSNSSEFQSFARSDGGCNSRSSSDFFQPQDTFQKEAKFFQSVNHQLNSSESSSYQSLPSAITVSSPETIINVTEHDICDNFDISKAASRPVILPPIISVPSVITATLKHVTSPDDFWMHLKDSKELSSSQPKESSPLSVQPGDFCYALSKKINKYYRAKVLTLTPDGLKVQVFFVDFGFYENIPVKNLRVLQNEAYEVPMQAFHCCLSNIVPKDGTWSVKSIQNFKEYEGVFEVHVKSFSDGKYEVELINFVMGFSMNVSEELCKDGFAICIEESSKNLYSPPLLNDKTSMQQASHDSGVSVTFNQSPLDQNLFLSSEIIHYNDLYIPPDQPKIYPQGQIMDNKTKVCDVMSSEAANNTEIRNEFSSQKNQFQSIHGSFGEMSNDNINGYRNENNFMAGCKSISTSGCVYPLNGANPPFQHLASNEILTGMSSENGYAARSDEAMQQYENVHSATSNEALQQYENVHAATSSEAMEQYQYARAATSNEVIHRNPNQVATSKCLRTENCECPLHFVVQPPKLHTFEGNRMLVMMSNIVSPSKFYVNPAMIESISMDELQEEMTMFYEYEGTYQEYAIAFEDLKVGMFCAARFHDDQGWYRAKILEVIFEDSNTVRVEVQYIDYGNKAMLPCYDLRLLKEEFVQHPILALECSLAAIVPKYDAIETVHFPWDEHSVAIFKQLVSFERILTAEIVENSEFSHRSGVIPVLLWDTENAKDVLINEELVYNNVALQTDLFREAENLKLWDPLEEEYEGMENSYGVNNVGVEIADSGNRETNDGRICRYYSLRNGYCPKGDKCTFDHVFLPEAGVTMNMEEIIFSNPTHKLPNAPFDVILQVSAVVNPERFYAVLPFGNKTVDEVDSLAGQGMPFDEDAKEVAALFKDMNDYYSNLPFAENTKDLLAIGVIVVAWRSVDHAWHRAKVIEVEVGMEEPALVFFVDFGDTSLVSRKNIRQIEEKYIFTPFQAIECRMADVEPLGCEIGKEWSNNSKNYFAKMVANASFLAHVVHRHGEVFFVILRNLTYDNHDYVSRQLVKEGFAQYCSKKTLKKKEGMYIPG